MTPTINISSFKRNLRETEDLSAKLSALPSQLDGIDSGVNYLITALLIPLLGNRRVSSTQLDMDRFDLEDIQTVYDLCGDEPETIFSDREKLRQVYELLLGATPKAAPVAFL